MDNKKSSPSAQSGRRKSGGSTQLRSPIVKRPSTAPVALQGWLHKQGSEGLMLWKKRWFVLSEYCLFYYKGPEEEKLLGSILLPSYKVSVCTADDKVYRKFAFKAEHVNMRTYYFAAESRELMTQWMNALSLATILQEGTKLPYQDHQNLTSMPSLVKQNSDEFGFQSYNAVSGPITVQPTSQDRNMKDSSANMNGWAGPNPAGPNQPLYANAPPKPKRLNNEGQYGSSPEASPNRRDDAENILYSSRKRFQETLNPARPQEYHYHSYKTGYPSGSIPDADMSRSISHSGTYSGEERSPVSTTWTDVKSTNFIRNMPREEELNSNYSDVFKNSNYNLGPPLRSEGTNFPGYGNSMNSSHANYQHPNQYYQSYQQSPQRQFDLQELESGRLDQGRRYQPPRPHSADFLDYDAKKYYPNKKNMESMIVEKSSGKFDQFNSPRPPRPKSSLDIVPSNDGYYWSEERYAEKMRQSAMYLQNTPTQRSQSSRANTPTARRTNESAALLPDVKNVNEQILANLRQKMTVPTTARQNLRRWSEHQDRIDNTFMRSASARVPKHGTHDDESDEVQAYTGGQDFNEGRKEESMKRLLEWKQRMLQSPLTRKLSGSSTRGVAQNELSKSYKQQVLKELEKQEAKSREDLGKRKSKTDGSRIQNRMSDSRRSAILSSDRYYSYSSDDEASGSGSVMREVHLPSSSSTLPQMGRQAQKVSLRVTPSPSGLNEESLGSNQKLNQLGRSLPDFIDRTEYYDRGKGFITMQNGYDERNDGYGTRREDIGGGEDRTSSSSERGRALDERNYYVDQYQDRKLGGYHRNSGSLLMNKNGVTKPSSPMNVLTSPMGRAPESQDGRYLGKENLVKRKVSSSPWGLDVSAGELLGRTHEELVLLLIQLRRQSASVCKAMESCHIEIEEQARLAELDTPKRMEHIRKLEKLKKHLLELEKQYEKGKPLVNLVDNMVKLGSLYKGNNHAFNGGLSLEHSPNVREKLEFNQKVQEQRLLAEERRDWDRLSSDHGQLQAKVQQLYKLDRLLQEESGTLHILQQDKELLEKALGGLRHKLQVNRSNPVEADRCRKQQKLIEKELSRVRLLLAHNSKKLEETVAENARLEQELVILRQKLQASRVSSRSSMPILPESTTLSTTAALEAELRRVQQLVGDLQRQRHELSAQVKQLTEKSDTLVQQIRPGPTGVAGAGPIPGKKKSSATWLETDLDLLITQDVGVESQVTSPQQQQQPMLVPGSRSTTPIYINTETSKKDALNPTEDSNRSIVNKPSPVEELQTKAYCTPVELSEADERMKRFYGIIPKEKQEIKTVRIVKRESERRQRDRDRSGNIGIPIGNMAVAKRVSVIDENDSGGLGRVDEEGYDNMHNPHMYNNYIEEQKLTDYRSSEEGQDPFMNFHPTNPFLPHNLADNLNEDVLVVDMDPVTSPGKRSQSLPRGFGKTGMPNQPPKYEGPPALRNAMSKRNRVRFDTQSQEGSGSESGPNSPRSDNSSKNYGGCRTQPNEYSAGRKNSKSSEACQSFSPNGSCGPAQVVRGLRLYSEQQREHEAMRKEKMGPEIQTRPLTAREQLFGSGYSLNDEPSPQLSPVYQSEAAREIIMEMSGMPVKRPLNRRPIRKEKRRHHTVSNIRHVTDSESHLSRMGSARSRDDLDMERALRPRMNAPDVVRSTMNHKDLKYNESTIDSILGTPNKIVIPERYIPEQEMLTAEEQMQRSRKAESIRKMLSETTAISTPDLSSEGLEEERKSCTLRKKVEEEKKQREHLLELNQILAQQVMEKSKLVAGSISAPSHQQD